MAITPAALIIKRARQRGRMGCLGGQHRRRNLHFVAGVILLVCHFRRPHLLSSNDHRWPDMPLPSSNLGGGGCGDGIGSSCFQGIRIMSLVRSTYLSYHRRRTRIDLCPVSHPRNRTRSTSGWVPSTDSRECVHQHSLEWKRAKNKFATEYYYS